MLKSKSVKHHATSMDHSDSIQHFTKLVGMKHRKDGFIYGDRGLAYANTPFPPLLKGLSKVGKLSYCQPTLGPTMTQSQLGPANTCFICTELHTASQVQHTKSDLSCVQIHALEKSGGSIIGGAIKLLRDKKKNPAAPRDPSLPPKPKGQTVGSFKQGLKTLPEAIARKMDSKLR